MTQAAQAVRATRATRVGLLHTAEVHVATFDALLAERLPAVERRHVVDAALLAGVAPAELGDRLEQRLREAADDADLVLCTCSTIGGLAEGLAATVGVPVLRVDRPVAERVVALAGARGRDGGRVGLVTSVASTLGPTRELVAAAAADAGAHVELVDLPVAGAWALFEAGDLAGYHAAVAEHVRAVAGRCEVVLLAQASMAPVADLVGGAVHETPVLASPAVAADRLVELLGGQRRR